MSSPPQSLRAIRSHSNKIAVFARLLDVIVIGLTLLSILDLSKVEWDNKHTWWLLIAIVGFGAFASLNDLYRSSRSMTIRTEVRLIAISWFCVLIILLCVDQGFLLIDPIYKKYFWWWNLAVPIEIISWHVIVRGLANKIRKMDKRHHRVAIVGATMLGAELRKNFLRRRGDGIRFHWLLR